MGDPIKFMSYHATVNVVDGKPQCTCGCGPMVEISPGQWQCSIGYAMWQAYRPMIDAMLAEALRPVETEMHRA